MADDETMMKRYDKIMELCRHEAEHCWELFRCKPSQSQDTDSAGDSAFSGLGSNFGVAWMQSRAVRCIYSRAVRCIYTLWESNVAMESPL
jgi:hypothetical protein